MSSYMPMTSFDDVVHEKYITLVSQQFRSSNMFLHIAI